LLDELDAVGDQPSERVLIDLDQRIHRHIYECAHSPFLATTLHEYYVLTLRIWFLALDRVPRLGDAVREHRELLEAIRDGDPDRAEETMRRHVRGFEDAVRRVF
jgi:GntR family transcriptional regulator, rspAB operon transcriptional repressor